jgi:hypothetical protein
MNDAEFDQLLRNADPGMKMKPDFRREVWRRIEAAESNAWTYHIRKAISGVFESLALPPVAAGTCAAAVIAGILFATLASRPDFRDDAAYLRSISPFLHQSSP